MLSNDHIVHGSTDSDKTGFRTNNGDNEYITWQPKQGDMEASNVLQKTCKSGVASRSNKNATDGRDNRIQNSKYSLFYILAMDSRRGCGLQQMCFVGPAFFLKK